MSGAPPIVFADEYLRYDLGSSHPLNQKRLRRGLDLIEQCGLAPQTRQPRVATEGELRGAHAPAYVDFVREHSANPEATPPRHGFGSADNPPFEGMFEAAALHVGGTVEAVDLAVAGGRAFNLGGGFHHAFYDRASGFCIFNDPAIGIHRLLGQHGLARVLYVDTDAHHADGVQKAFYLDPRVLTVSFHESGRTLFPGTGWVSEVGDGPGRGYSVNVPLPAYTGAEPYLAAFEAIVPPLAAAFRPQALVTQFGADAYAGDPLAHLLLTPRAYDRVAATYDEIARRFGIPWVAMTGGGYDAESCARAWTVLYARMAGAPLEESAAGRAVLDARVEEPVGEPLAIARVVERVVADVKEAVFPFHGLAPAR